MEFSKFNNEENYKPRYFSDIRNIITDYKLNSLNLSWAHCFLGDGYFYNGDYKKAIKSYSEAITNNPDADTIYHNRAHGFIKLGEFKKLKKTLQKQYQLILKTQSIFPVVRIIFR